jgi:CheY-like chemotaxis protein
MNKVVETKCAHPAQSSGTASQARKNRGARSSIVILLVDDDPDCRMLVRDAIIGSHVCNSVYEVANGADAMAFLRRQGEWENAPRPGLIYMDIEMPGLNGLETLKMIKVDRTLSDIPVVMMTGVCDETQMRIAAEAGANSYTIKPANSEQFLKTILTSTDYWLTIHQYPDRHLPEHECRR